jgi:hypothetical protein
MAVDGVLASVRAANRSGSIWRPRVTVCKFYKAQSGQKPGVIGQRREYFELLTRRFRGANRLARSLLHTTGFACCAAMIAVADSAEKVFDRLGISGDRDFRRQGLSILED